MHIHIPDFIIEQELHSSDYSIVYEGYHTKYAQKITVKVLKEEFPSLKSVARFNEEYEIARQFQFSKSRKVLEKLKIGSHHLLLLEHVEGQSLKQLIIDNQLSLGTQLHIAIGIAQALQEIHLAGVIHRDINPKNILVQATSDVKIIDFGLASRLQQQNYKPEVPDALQGTLAYIAPEQTGRMNHSVDCRADLYSLGVTLYELFTGQLPFIAEDPMELLHAHIAKQPVAPKGLPVMLSRLIMKLLAKSPEERYQTARGVLKDLEKILQLVSQHQPKEEFLIGEFDFRSTFHIPEKLYGREKEVQTLLTTFEHVAMGNLHLTLVGGYSGIGKTVLISELFQPITVQRGYFMMGKYDQFQRDTPYSAIIQALKDFVAQILLEKEDKIKSWRKKILQLVGSNAQVIIEVVPSLELILGKQPPVPELPPVESQNRFNYVFQQFIKSLSREEHPIVLFIDDWQWADLSSLNFLRVLIEGENHLALHIIGAYRDNEVHATHPFVMLVEDLKNKHFPIDEIFLQPISAQDVNLLVADTLKTPTAKTATLTHLIYEKTQGNPFFVTQFFKTLYDEALIVFDVNQQEWTWDNQQINQQKITNNVVDLMTTKIQRLSSITQQQLQYAACIGNIFDLKTLARIAGQDQKTTLDQLWSAITEGLIRPQNDNYQAIDTTTTDAQVYFSFLHDRVQQAAYSLVSPADREVISLNIGRVAYHQNNDKYRQEWICDIANYYNKGRRLITTTEEQILLAQINWQAGIKAKRANAYSNASNFLQNTIALSNSIATPQAVLPPKYLLYKEAAETSYLAGNNAEATNLYQLALTHTHNHLEKIEVYCSQVRQFQTEGRFEESYQTELNALAMLGIIIPHHEQDILPYFQAELGNTQGLLNHRSFDDLLNAPAMTDVTMQWAMQLLDMLFVTCFISGRNTTLVWCISKMTNISLQYGNTVYASQAYVAYGLLCCVALNQVHEGYKFGKLAIDLSDRYNNLVMRSKAYHTFATCVVHWTKDPSECLYYYKEGSKYGLEGGEFEYGTFALFGYMHESLRISVPLQTLAPEAMKAKEVIKKYNPAAAQWVYAPSIVQPIKHLLGETLRDDTFDTEDFSEEQFLITYQHMPLAQAWLYSAQLRNFYIMGHDHKALALIDKTALIAAMHVGIITTPLSYYYALLAILACWQTLSSVVQASYQPQIDDYFAKLRTYAQNCPSHYEAKLALAEAEFIAYIEQGTWKAIEAYDKAIVLAQNTADFQQEAIAAERAAKYLLGHQKNDFAKLYLQRAYYAYTLWGATGKEQQLKAKHPYLFDQKQQQSSTLQSILGTQHSLHNVGTTSKSSFQSSQQLDMSSIIKATQAISQEIKLENLLSQMLHIVIENAGAEQGCLVLKEHNELLVQAHVSMQIDNYFSKTLQAAPLAQSQQIPADVISYVARTKESIILVDARKDTRFGRNNYINTYKVKSLYCSPILKQGEVVAVLYLENRQITGLFTPENTFLLTMLSSQMAISIDNALVYKNMESIVEARTLELQERNQRITDSIKYAQTIQQAILPTDQELQSYFKEYFVIFRPKDIVSGDFYWAAKIAEKHLVAVIDCTGHGVPGAFMSMITNTLLEELVMQKRITNPAIILAELNTNIRKALKQDTSHNRDGMDLVFCTITSQLTTTHVEFAGAKRPLWYLQNNEMLYIDGDRKSIGGVQKDNERLFTLHTLHLVTGTMLYLFSDGFTDQNDAERTRFGSKKLQETILAAAHLDMPAQGKFLEQSIVSYMTNTTQRDDITGIGIKL